MLATDLHGIFPALPTPMTPDMRPDLTALGDLVERNLAAGVPGLVPMGGTGEFTVLSPEDRVAVVRRTVEVAGGAVPVVPGVLSTGFADAVRAGQDFRAAGADAIMLVTPFYVIPTQQGVADYFRAYRAAVDCPLVYYDIPARTGFYTQIDTMAQLAEDGTIIGAKVCNTDAHYFNRLAERVGDRISLLSGDDMLYAIHVMHGARGGVLASAPLLPKTWVDIHKMLTGGDLAGGIARHRTLLPVFRALFNEVNPGPLKAMMAAMGHPVGGVALPLRDPGEETQALMRTALEVIRREAMA
ncbi:dihydrodipicolinate synthase family protein [Falsirhodobacter halotolerans]|uniref:dihydrodipicolinate synthase family protein n=1 Tax=Falsirhodobacter halotolerans TaxID=1146892 RepID=UPI001FD3B184|nr:dihydrodipicolinate synthase family protein [Falsirhodobacter halotolerans]MCJ8141011.1 dihydrodipicolinate synthase family protein [Falsirhodobacter halotolerans]